MRRGRPRRHLGPGDGRPRSGSDVLELEEVHRFPNGGGPRTTTARCAGTSERIYARDARRAAAAAAGRTGRRRSGSTRGRSTTGCSTRTGGCSATPYSPPRRAHRRRRARRSSPRSATRSCTPPPGSSSCRSTRSTSSSRPGHRPSYADATTLLLLPDLLGYWLTGERRRRAHQRLDHAALRRALARVGDRPLLERLGLPDRPAARRCATRAT